MYVILIRAGGAEPILFLSTLKRTLFSLTGLKSLYGLRLAGNRIAKLGEKTFVEADNIKMLNLADNRILTIEQDAFLPLKKLKVSNERKLFSLS